MLLTEKQNVVGNLYTENHSKVSRLCRHYFHSNEEVEDAVQEIFLNVFRNIEQFNGRAKMTTWLYAISQNTCKNIYNRKNTGKRRGFQVDVTECYRLSLPDNLEQKVAAKRKLEEIGKLYERSCEKKKKKLDVLFNYASEPGKTTASQRQHILRARIYLRKNINYEI